MPLRRRTLHTAFVATLAAASASLSLPASAGTEEEGGEELVCDERHSIDPWQLARRLSLDLAGTHPSIEVFDAIDAVAGDPDQERAVLDALVADLLASDGFRASMRRYHEAMLWPNVANVRLADNRAILSGQAILASASASRRTLYRGDPDRACGDFEHVQFDAAGVPELQDDWYGWTMVTPYWGGAAVKVCAHEAQEIASVSGTDCNTSAGSQLEACGCGPNLRYCYGNTAGVEVAIAGSLREQLLRAVDDAVAEGADYTDLVLSTDAWQDGKIAFWKRNLATFVSLGRTYNDPDPDEEVTDAGYADAAFSKVDRGPEAAGVLTLPGYLLKFQTGRARANRFRQAFQCQSFEPPSSTEDEGCSMTSNDLTERCTCRYCHLTLEPLAIGMSRFVEAGTTVMSDPEVFAPFDPSCQGSNNGFCKRFYVTAEDDPNAGKLRPLEFADVHEDHTAVFEAGPRGIAKPAIWVDGDPSGEVRTEPGSFASCSVRRAFTHFLRRDPTSSEEATIEALAAGFGEGGFDFQSLVTEIVSLDAYRSAR